MVCSWWTYYLWFAEDEGCYRKGRLIRYLEGKSKEDLPFLFVNTYI